MNGTMIQTEEKIRFKDNIQLHVLLQHYNSMETKYTEGKNHLMFLF